MPRTGRHQRAEGKARAVLLPLFVLEARSIKQLIESRRFGVASEDDVRGGGAICCTYFR